MKILVFLWPIVLKHNVDQVVLMQSAIYIFHMFYREAYNPYLYKYNSKWFYLMFLNKSRSFVSFCCLLIDLGLSKETFLAREMVTKKNINESHPATEALFPT